MDGTGLRRFQCQVLVLTVLRLRVLLSESVISESRGLNRQKYVSR
jgi:hypothetical protein